MKPRLGLIVPDDGPLDYELYRMAPWLEQVGLEIEVLVENSPTPGVEVSAKPSRLEHCLRETGSDGALIPCARRLADLGCHAIVWACTSGSFIGGLAWARRQADRLQSESGLPASSTTLSIVAAVRALDCTAVDVLSTYPEYVTGRFVALLEEAGIEVVQTVSLECDPNDGIAKYANFVIDLDLIDALLRFDRADSKTRPLIVPNTSMNTLTKVDDMERAAGRTVVTANQAIFWQAMGLLQCRDAASGAGSLFRAAYG